MHHLTSQSADRISDELHKLADESDCSSARNAFLHAAKLLHRARVEDFANRELIHRDPLGLRTQRQIRLLPSAS